MIIRKFILISFVFIALTGCKKETDTPIDKDKGLTPAKNSPPSSFTVRVLIKSYNYAVIDWDPAIDADGDSLYYTVYFNDSVIVENSKRDMILRFENLKPYKNYEGKIEVTDKKSAAVSVPFSFTTSKYFLKYKKTLKFENGNSIDKTNDGGYIIGGGIHSDGEPKLNVVKIDSLGIVQWHHAYTQGPDEVVQIKQTKDHGYIVIGIRNIVKINEAGIVEWMSYEETSENPVNLSSVVQTKDEGFLVFGNHMRKMCLYKFDKSGNKKWTKEYGDYDLEMGSYILDCNDNNYIIFGDTGPSYDHDFWTAKIDSAGNIIWQNTYGDNRYDFASQIIKANDGGYIISGYSWGERNISQVHIIKIDDNGNKIWDKSLSPYGDQSAISVTSINNNEYIITGYVYWSSSSDLLLIKLDNQGNIIWNKIYGIDGVNYYCYGRDVKQTSDGGFIVVGDVGNTYDDYLNECGIWLLKLDSDGNYN